MCIISEVRISSVFNMKLRIQYHDYYYKWMNKLTESVFYVAHAVSRNMRKNGHW